MNRTQLLAAAAACLVAGASSAAVRIDGKGGLIRVSGTTTTGNATTSASKPASMSTTSTRSSTTTIVGTTSVPLTSGAILVPGRTVAQRTSVLDTSVPTDRPVGPTLGYIVPASYTTGAAVYLDPVPFTAISPTYPQVAGMVTQPSTSPLLTNGSLNGTVTGYVNGVGVGPAVYGNTVGMVNGNTLGTAIANGAFVPASAFRTVGATTIVTTGGSTTSGTTSSSTTGASTTGSSTVGSPTINSGTALTTVPGATLSTGTNGNRAVQPSTAPAIRPTQLAPVRPR